jgi:hypothetical protein
LEVDVSPFEVVDLILGLIGLDLASDDPEPVQRGSETE